jgi:hypothetical protein
MNLRRLCVLNSTLRDTRIVKKLQGCVVALNFHNHIADTLNSFAITVAISATEGFFSLAIFSAADCEQAVISVSRSCL